MGKGSHQGGSHQNPTDSRSGFADLCHRSPLVHCCNVGRFWRDVALSNSCPGPTKIWVHSPAANGCNNKKSGAFVALFFTVLGNLGWAWRYLEKVSRENFLQLECTRLCFSGANLHWWNDSPTILHKNQAMSPTSCWMLWPSSSSLISTTCSTRHLLRNHAIMPGTGGTAPFELGSYLQGLRSMMINDWISAVFCAIWHWIATYPPEV